MLDTILATFCLGLFLLGAFAFFSLVWTGIDWIVGGPLEQARREKARQRTAAIDAMTGGAIDICVGALDRALDAMARGDRKLAEREIEYVRDVIDGVA